MGKMKEKWTVEKEQALMDVENFGNPVDLLEERDQAYTERNEVVAFLARLCYSISSPGDNLYGAGLAEDLDAEPGWQNVVFIDTPVGQLSWHLHDRELGLLHTLPRYRGKWDGHSTPEKRRRLNQSL